MYVYIYINTWKHTTLVAKRTPVIYSDSTTARYMWCSVLHCVAVCCSVLQCVAVCCSVLRKHTTLLAKRAL